jgi:peptide/nickel transport system substrate-binding protein
MSTERGRTMRKDTDCIHRSKGMMNWLDWRAKALATLLSINALMALSACGGGTSSSGDSQADAGPVQRGGTLKLATPVEPGALDPTTGVAALGDLRVEMVVFDRLIEVKPGSVRLEPGLAASWALSSDRKSATFRLRDAKFSDGTPVTSADVKFSLERAMNPKLSVYFGPMLARMIESVTTPDEHTVVLHFDGPQPMVFSYLASVGGSVVSKRAFERLGAKRFAKLPVDGGSGPFKVVKWARGRSVKLARNAHYWRKGQPYLDEVELIYEPDGNTRMLKLRSGQVDVADDVPYSQLDAMDSAPGIKVQGSQVAAVYTLWLNVRGVLRPQAVRQALAYATPTRAIREIVFKDRVEIANTVLPPMRYNDLTVKPTELDVDKAKQLLAQAGLKDGVDLTMVIGAGDLVTRQTASIIQSAWSQVGVNLKILSLDPASLGARLGEADFNVAMFAPTAISSDIPSEDEIATNIATPDPSTGFADLKLYGLLKRIQGTWNEETRRELYAQFQRQLLINPTAIPMTVASAQTAMRDDVQGFDYIITNYPYLNETWIKR